jgi:lipoprotein signal peptidase
MLSGFYRWAARLKNLTIPVVNIVDVCLFCGVIYLATMSVAEIM